MLFNGFKTVQIKYHVPDLKCMKSTQFRTAPRYCCSRSRIKAIPGARSEFRALFARPSISRLHQLLWFALFRLKESQLL